MRRFMNWFPLGLAYAFLYMGRYNLTVAKNALGEAMTKEDFGVIFGVGTLVYGLSFIINGPLTDRIGGKAAMMLALVGTGVVNALMGGYLALTVGGDTSDMRLTFTVLYATNMYFQSFGAVAIVKVNAHWFHVRERGGFSGIFGTMISSGIFFAFTVNGWILDLASTDSASRALAAKWVFFVPAVLLLSIAVAEWLLLRDRPSLAGHEDFDTGDARLSDDDKPLPTFEVLKRMLSHPVLLTIAGIEFCTGVLRQAVMHWTPIYTKESIALPDAHWFRNGEWAHLGLVLFAVATGVAFLLLARRVQGSKKAWFYVSGALVFLAPFLSAGWGGILFVAGVIGGNVAGWVSDLFFQSRRAPAAGGLYFVLTIAALGMVFALGEPTNKVAWIAANKAPGGLFAWIAANKAPGAKAAAASGLDQLMPGDEVVAIAGTPVENWSDVQQAVACIPAACRAPARFDTVTCICATAPEQAYVGTPHSGPIAARVVRDGKTLELRLADPGAKMRAGDRRALKAGPVSTRGPILLAIIVFVMSLCVIGTHGLLSGTATMDFGGRKSAATAVGLIDGFVYLGTAVQSFALGYLTTKDWAYWPIFMVPFAVVGFLLTLRIWNAKPRAGTSH